MRVLFVSPYVPSTVRVRPYYWVKYLAALGHEIVLLTLADDEPLGPGLDEMRRLCARVIAVPLSRARMIWNAVSAVASDEPVQMACMRQPELARSIRTELARTSFDVAHIEHLRGAGFADAIEGVPVVFDAVDSISLLFAQTQRQGPRLRDRAMARLDRRRTERFEAAMLDRFARVLVTSPDDAEHVRRLAGGTRQPVVLPNPVDLTYFRPGSDPREPATILFSGKMSYHANIAAAAFLVRDVMPIVWRARPDARVTIAGQSPARSVRALARDARVMVTGRVPDLRSVLVKASIAVCPIPYGAGIQNKVLEAMATATPVVASTRVRRALNATPGRDLVLAERADDFGREIVALLESPGRRDELGRHGRSYVESHHEGTALAARLVQTYREAGEGTP